MRNKKGFTLIELLAVIVIIAIIALIGIPSVTNIINNSRKDSIKSTALAMANAARNRLAAENWTVPTGATGCRINWNDLGMESSQLPVGGTVNALASRVVITTDGSKNTYTIFLVNGTTAVGTDTLPDTNDDVVSGAVTGVNGVSTALLSGSAGRTHVLVDDATNLNLNSTSTPTPFTGAKTIVANGLNSNPPKCTT